MFLIFNHSNWMAKRKHKHNTCGGFFFGWIPLLIALWLLDKNDAS